MSDFLEDALDLAADFLWGWDVTSPRRTPGVSARHRSAPTRPRRTPSCDRPPSGWRCTRHRHHSGPCPAVPTWWNRSRFARTVRRADPRPGPVARWLDGEHDPMRADRRRSGDLSAPYREDPR